jgi:hypothetical protein
MFLSGCLGEPTANPHPLLLRSMREARSKNSLTSLSAEGIFLDQSSGKGQNTGPWARTVSEFNTVMRIGVNLFPLCRERNSPPRDR